MTLGSSLPTFHDFNVATRDVKLTGVDTLVNEATKNTYLIDRMMAGRDIAKLQRGGKKLVHHIQGGHGNTYGPYDPGQEETPEGSDHLVETETLWSFNRSYYVYDDEDTELNDGDEDRYLDLKESYELGCAVDTVNGMEEQLFALPDRRKMEHGTLKPRAPYSLLCFITRDGGLPSSTNGGVAPGSGDWTTLLSISDDTYDWWKNAVRSYSAAAPDDPDQGLIKAFSSMVLKIRYEMPNEIKKYSNPDGNASMRKQMILTNEDGHTFYEARLRNLNDRMRLINDPHISDIQYKGIPVSYIAQLDNVGWTEGQPDYIFANFNFIYPVFRRGWVLKNKLVDGGSKQPNRHVNYKFTWWNNTCESRRRQGRVSAA